MLDGQEVLRSERILAAHQLPHLRAVLDAIAVGDRALRDEWTAPVRRGGSGTGGGEGWC
jgi:hypothetical protein